VSNSQPVVAVPQISTSQITALTLDTCRKVIIGTSSGEIECHSFVNGTLGKNIRGHTSDIACMQYCKEVRACCAMKSMSRAMLTPVDRQDMVFITASWDRSIRVWDDGSNDGLRELRTIENAHSADITCLDFSYELSVVVTGCADGCVRVWDFQVSAVFTFAACGLARQKLFCFARWEPTSEV
jgi:WD40 repeat protein